MTTPYTISFFGQTGFGKSTLINTLFGASFNTDPLVSCTKELYSVTTLTPARKLITVFDTPGIGEFSSNSAYEDFYRYAFSQSDCVVLVVSLDRTDSTAQELLESMKPYLKDGDVKFVIALNRIDSAGVGENKDYVSWDVAANRPSKAALERIERRKATITENFEDVFLPFTIVPVCAPRNYGLDILYKTITDNGQ